MIGHDLEREDIRTFRVSRIRCDIRFATRRERDFRLPAEFDVESYRGRADVAVRRRRRRGADRGRAATRPGGSSASTTAPATGSRTMCSSPSTPRSPCSRAGSCGRTAAPSRSSRRSCAGSSPKARAPRGAPTKARPPSRRRRSARGRRPAGERPTGPVAPERFGVLQSLLAYLLTACGDNREANITAQELVDRFSIPRDQLEEHLSLLNLVNFGGGCYAVYAELRGDAVHVDKELFGDTFRRAAAADAARGAGDPAGARVRRPDGRRRTRTRRSTGCARSSRRRSASSTSHRRRRCRSAPRRISSRKLTQAIDEHRARRDRVPEAGGAGGRDAHRRAVLDRAPAAVLVRPHVGHRARPARVVPPRPDARREGRCARRSSRGRASTRRVCGARAPRASGTRRPWRAGRSRRALAGSSTAPHSRRRRSAAPNGSSARSSPTAARRSCSSRSSSGHGSPSGRASSGSSSVRRARRASLLARAPRRAPTPRARRAARRRRREALEQRLVARVAGVAERDERVAAEPARVVARDEQAVVLGDQRARRRSRARPAGRRGRASARRRAGAALLDASVPRADVLADVAAVDLRAELARDTPPGSRAAPASSTTGTGSRRASRPRRARRSGTRRCRGGTSPQSVSSGGVGASSTSVTSAPRTTHEPWRRVISSVFLP